jgi:hypothetical protein
MNVKSKGQKIFRPTTLIQNHFGSTDIYVPLSANVSVIGNVLTARLKIEGVFDESDPIITPIIDIVMDTLGSLSQLILRKGGSTNKDNENLTGDALIKELEAEKLYDLIRQDSLIAQLLTRASASEDRRSELFTLIFDTLAKELIGRGVTLSDLLRTHVLDDADYASAIATLYESLDLNDLSAFYSKSADLHQAVFRGEDILPIGAILKKLVDNPYYAFYSAIKRMQRGSHLVRIPMDIVSAHLKMDSHFTRTRIVDFKIGHLETPEDSVFDMRDIYAALAMIEKMILGVDNFSSPITEKNADDVTLETVMRRLKERSRLESVFDIPEGADVAQAEKLVKFLFGQFMLMRYTRDARGNYFNTIRSSENFKNLSKKDTISRLLHDALSAADTIISSLLDVHSYLAGFLDTGVQYYVDRTGKAPLNPWIMYLSKVIYDQKRAAVSTAMPLSVESALYPRTYNIILNHSPIANWTYELEGDIHMSAPPPRLGKQVTFINHQSAGTGISATSHAVFSKRVQTLPGAEQRDDLVLGDLDLVLLHSMSSPNPYGSIMLLTEEISSEFGSRHLKDLIPMAMCVPAFFVSKGMSKVASIAVSDFLLTSPQCERLLYSSFEELSEDLVLPAAVFKAVEVFSKGGRTFKKADVDFLLDLGLDISVFNKLYKDFYAIIRLPGRIMIKSKEPILEFAFRNPSDSNTGRLEVAFGEFPLLLETSTKTASTGDKILNEAAEKSTATDESLTKSLEDLGAKIDKVSSKLDDMEGEDKYKKKKKKEDEEEDAPE